MDQNWNIKMIRLLEKFDFYNIYSSGISEKDENVSTKCFYQLPDFVILTEIYSCQWCNTFSILFLI